LRATDIRMRKACSTASSANRLDDVFTEIVLDISDENAGTLVRKGLSDLAADALGSPSYNRHLAVEAQESSEIALR
jgi:hypothetical protein